MGIFNFFRKQTSENPLPADGLQLQGPNYLRKYLIKPSVELSNKIKISHPDIQWAGQLISSAGNEYFKIKYFGDLLSNTTIIASGERVQRVVAIDPQTEE